LKGDNLGCFQGAILEFMQRGWR